jgi:hypothetical protein
MKVKDLNYQKYLKYKNKYLDLQNQIEGGGIFAPSKEKIRLDQIKLELEKLYNESDLEKMAAEIMLELIEKSDIHDQLKMENENNISKQKQLEMDVDQLSLDYDQYKKDIDNYNVEKNSIDAKPYNIETNIELYKKMLKDQKELKKRELQMLEKQKEIKERSDKLLKNMKKITESIEKNGKKLTELTERGEQIKKLKERKKELERERDLLIKKNTLSNRLSKIFKH